MNNQNYFLFLFLLILLCASFGCEGTKPSFTVDHSPSIKSPAESPTKVIAEVAETATENSPSEATSEPAKTMPETASATEPQNENLQRAEVGVGKQTQQVSRAASAIGLYPLTAFCRTQERIVFEIQIPHALKLFHATNERFPNSFEEYQQEILQPSQIKLPELPANREYLYLPETGELMVRSTEVE